MEKQKIEKIKKIGGIALDVVLWAFVIFAVVITIIAVSAGTNAKNVPAVGGRCYLSVWSGSMDAKKPDWVEENKPSGFKKGDLIISDYIYGNSQKINALAKGDVITFEFDRNNNGLNDPGEYNTHRIVDIEYYGDGEEKAGQIKYIITQGDNNLVSTETVGVDQIIAVYTGRKIGALGSVFDFLNQPLGFGLCILLPLVLFFAYQLFVFIKTYISVKNEGKKLITADDEELIKQRAIEEYLRSKAEQNGENADFGENAKSESGGNANGENKN